VHTERINNAQYTGDCDFGLQNSASLEGILKVFEAPLVLVNLGIDDLAESVLQGLFP